MIEMKKKGEAVHSLVRGVFFFFKEFSVTFIGNIDEGRDASQNNTHDRLYIKVD